MIFRTKIISLSILSMIGHPHGPMVGNYHLSFGAPEWLQGWPLLAPAAPQISPGSMADPGYWKQPCRRFHCCNITGSGEGKYPNVSHTSIARKVSPSLGLLGYIIGIHHISQWELVFLISFASEWTISCPDGFDFDPLHTSCDGIDLVKQEINQALVAWWSKTKVTHSLLDNSDHLEIQNTDRNSHYFFPSESYEES